MEANTTLVSHETKSGTKNGREWHLHVFTASDGTSFSTFDTDVANKAYGLLNQSATVTFEQKPANNPAYPPRNTITGVTAGGAVGGITTGTPVQPGTGYASTIPTFPQNPPASAPVASGVVTEEQRQLRIMRQSAIDRAIAASAAGLISPDLEAVYSFSEELIGYFQNGTKRVSPRTLEDEFAGTGF